MKIKNVCLKQGMFSTLHEQLSSYQQPILCQEPFQFKKKKSACCLYTQLNKVHKMEIGSSDDIDVLMYTIIAVKVLNVVDASIKTDIF